MSEDAIETIAVVVTIGVLVSALGLALGAITAAPGIISDHQRYTTYLEAQRTVLRCRADHSIAAIDRVCGPIPTLESIK